MIKTRETSLSAEAYGQVFMLLRRYMVSDDWHERAILARCENAPSCYLHYLVLREKDWQVRVYLARNRQLPTMLQVLLASNKNEFMTVKEELLCNPSLCIEAFNYLAREKNWRMRKACVLHKLADVSFLYSMLQDRHKEVRDAAKERLEAVNNE